MKRQIIGVYGFVLNSQEQFLIIQRSKKDTYPGLWELPGGGIDFNERVEDAVKREVKEETGLDIEVIHPITVGNDTDHKAQLQMIRIVYLCQKKLETQEVKLSKEHDDFVWISLDQYYDTKKTNLSREIMSHVQTSEIIKDIVSKYSINDKKEEV